MQPRGVPKFKLNAMRKLFIKGELQSCNTAKALNLAACTVWKYKKEFQQIRELYPEKLTDMNFYLPAVSTLRRQDPRRLEVIHNLPLFLEGEAPGVGPKALWRKYKLIITDPYSYDNFKDIFQVWVKQHPEWAKPFLLREIAKEDMETLRHWRLSKDRRKWQIAVTLDMALRTLTADPIMDKTEATRKSVFGWIRSYKAKGMAGLELPARITPPCVVSRQQQRKDNIFRLLQDTPKLHGINRTSWSITCLTPAYNKIHQEDISYMQVSYCLRQMGFRYQKSREVLTSQDPKFREKINTIQRILQKLRPDEKFFSIDEYGPVGVKVKGGRTLKHMDEAQATTVKKQKVKGVIICTAALELSANQVTHFYSLKKNTFEMIRLIDKLLLEYHDQRTLYLCWDAVSWHRSAILMNHIADHNGSGKGPVVKLAPLPSTTQYLNVIESVFGGLAMAVIHNSDYASLEECKAAIDLHFETRNQYFRDHPKRAGKKIWGKEAVVPEFKDTQVCRKRAAMKGAR